MKTPKLNPYTMPKITIKIEHGKPIFFVDKEKKILTVPFCKKYEISNPTLSRFKIMYTNKKITMADWQYKIAVIVLKHRQGIPHKERIFLRDGLYGTATQLHNYLGGSQSQSLKRMIAWEQGIRTESELYRPLHPTIGKSVAIKPKRVTAAEARKNKSARNQLAKKCMMRTTGTWEQENLTKDKRNGDPGCNTLAMPASSS